MLKQYLLQVLEAVSDIGPEQDAVESAILRGAVPLTYEIARDVSLLRMNLPDLVKAYRREHPEIMWPDTQPEEQKIEEWLEEAA